MEYHHRTVRHILFTGFVAHIIVLLSACAEQSSRTASPTAESPDSHRYSLDKVMADSYQAMRERIAAGADINHIEPGAGTPLFQAIYPLHSPETVKFLLDSGADANLGDEDNTTPLYFAVTADEDYAARDEVLATVRLLLEHGADVNARIKAADGFSWVEGETPLHQAVSWEYIDYESDEHIGYSNLPVVNCLLQHGAYVSARDAWGNTPLHSASLAHHVDVVRLLLDYGADVNARSAQDGATPLHVCVSGAGADLAIAGALIARGADVHARDKEWETPMHIAAFQRDEEMCRLLEQHGGDMCVRSKRGETPESLLEEPISACPVLISDPNDYPYALVVTNGRAVRRRLQVESIDYDSLWFPGREDILPIETYLRESVLMKSLGPDIRVRRSDSEPAGSGMYCREYAGFVLYGKKYVFCCMMKHTEDTHFICNDYSFDPHWDSDSLVVVLDARSHRIVMARCNGGQLPSRLP